MTGHASAWKVEGERARAALEERLLVQMTPTGMWQGELSSSALATAVAIVALQQVDPECHAAAIEAGVRWLRRSVNVDGGWGDSPTSRSNLSTTTLAWAALAACRGRDVCRASRDASAWIRREVGSLDAAPLADALAASYGADRTFSAPILAVAALAGTLGEAPDCWCLVPQLPFECAVLPHRLLSWLRLPVVSYALPALIAIGLVRHRHRPSGNLLAGALRESVTSVALAKLARVQPSSGGFLEATPLTAFVTMSLAACGLGHSQIVARGVAFLTAGQRPDGSWPIDSNLATWVSTLAIKALAASGRTLPELREQQLLDWLLHQQLRQTHPFTQATPGGFAWTDLPGGVPDADDTAGALLALHALDPAGQVTRDAARRGIAWLVALQNRDGGVPTFCRGWGRLPFDKSCPDITAHALRAIYAWRGALQGQAAHDASAFVPRALRYLARVQRPDGSWLPLWFGSQWHPKGHNPVYGTAQVVLALRDIDVLDGELTVRLARATDWLGGSQNEDGGWGRSADGHSTIEETGLALASLAGGAPEATLARGAAWLTRRALAGDLTPAPIGLYFSRLWYAERLYPIIFGLLGLGRVLGARRDQATGCEGMVA